MIEEGIISQMVTLPSNMFSSVTLPATLWFFDKQKPRTNKKNEILFIDARNVFTQVDRAHRKFSDEQIENLSLISKLYQGDKDSYTTLINKYKNEVLNRCPKYESDAAELCKVEFSYEYELDGIKMIHTFNPLECSYELEYTYFESNDISDIKYFRSLIAEQNALLAGATQKKEFDSMIDGQQDKFKNMKMAVEKNIALGNKILYFIDNYLWIKERFPDGVYTDVIGLCKVAPMDGEDGIIDQNYSLNAGRYVGVVIEDDGLSQEEFKEEMYSLNAEFTSLSAEAKTLEKLIANHLKGLLGE